MNTKELEGHKKNKLKEKDGTTAPPLPKFPKRWLYAKWC